MLSASYSVLELVLVVTTGRFHSAITADVFVHGVVGIGPVSSVQRGVVRDRSILLLSSVTISISLSLYCCTLEYIRYPDMPAVVMPIAPGKPGT